MVLRPEKFKLFRVTQHFRNRAKYGFMTSVSFLFREGELRLSFVTVREFTSSCIWISSMLNIAFMN